MNLLGSLTATVNSLAQPKTGTLPASEEAMFGDTLPFRLQLASTTAPVMGSESLATSMCAASGEGRFTLESGAPQSLEDLPAMLGLVDQARPGDEFDYSDNELPLDVGLVPGLSASHAETITGKVDLVVTTHARAPAPHASLAATTSAEGAHVSAAALDGDGFDLSTPAPGVAVRNTPSATATSADILPERPFPPGRPAEPTPDTGKSIADALSRANSNASELAPGFESAEQSRTIAAEKTAARTADSVPAPFAQAPRIEGDGRPAIAGSRDAAPLAAPSDAGMAGDTSQDSASRREFAPRRTENGDQTSPQTPPQTARGFAESFDAMMQQPATPPQQTARAANTPADIPVTGSSIPLDQQFGQRLSTALGAAMSTMTINDGRIRLQVAPDHLGLIDIEFDRSGPNERLSITVENEAVRQAVAQAQGRIDMDLRQAGTRLAGIDVAMRDSATDGSANDPANGSRDDASGQQFGDGRSGHANAPGNANVGTDPAADTAHPTPMPGDRPGSIRYA